MINIDILELAKWAAALTAVGGLIFGIGRPVAKILVKLNRYLSKAQYEELGIRTVLKYRLSVLCPRVINRAWMTPIESATIKDGQASYEGLEGNGEIKALVSAALEVPVRHISYEDYLALAKVEDKNEKDDME